MKLKNQINIGSIIQGQSRKKSNDSTDDNRQTDTFLSTFYSQKDNKFPTVDKRLRDNLLLDGYNTQKI